MTEKVKLFYKWYFKDNIVIPYSRFDESSKRLGRIISILFGLGWLGLFTSLTIIKGVSSDPRFWLVFLLPGIIGPWIQYRFIRLSFWAVIWMIDGFGKSKK
jgi:hypothetical protein